MTQRYIELSISPDPGEADGLLSILSPAVGSNAVIEQQNGQHRVKAYLLQDASLPHSLELVQAILTEFYPHLMFAQRTLAEEDWSQSWKQWFVPIEVGQRLVVKPTWREYVSHSGQVVIQIDPGAAFGTGQHPSTRLCLLALEELLQPGMAVLDVGTGSGILAIAAAKLGATRVLARDTDPLAVKAAGENAHLNGVEDRIAVQAGSLDAIPAGSVDLILINISSETVVALAPAAAVVARPGAILVVSGFIAENLDRVVTGLGAGGWRAERVWQEGEWRAVAARGG